MAGLNKVILIGNLGKDPEIKDVGGRSVANFSLATTESYKDKTGNKIDTTEWHNLVLWSPLAEIASRFLKKGNQIYVEGRLRTRSWDDQQGNKKYTTEVIVNNMLMLGGPKDSSTQTMENTGNNVIHNSEFQQNTVSTNSDEGINDDLPF